MEQWWRPERFAQRRERLEQRGRILSAVRTFFAGQGFVEVDTPILQVSPGLEPHLRAFVTDLHDPRSGGTLRRYLHTSPEFTMKKLLAAGMPRIWQLAHVFRDGERSATHHPEFSLLEWYRTNASWRELIPDCIALIRSCQCAVGAKELVWLGNSADTLRPWQEMSVTEAFRRYTGIDILATAPDPLEPNAELLARSAHRAGIEPHPGDDWETLYFRIFLARIEPHLGIGAPTILYDFPASMAALSRRNPKDPRLAERFELYVCGLELANAFGELTEVVEQRARFHIDQAKKLALYGEIYPIDEDFLTALQTGLPPAAGIALGFDRLVMLCTAAPHIENVLWAPVS
jgi:elongation factor P--(R)-beta-lysine ligase